MSRHSRHRPGGAHRAPVTRTDADQAIHHGVPDLGGPVAAPDATVTALAERALAGESSPVMPMAAMHLPTATSPAIDEPGPPPAGCTPAQLRRFIKSRAYLPVHEIRRRFGIETADDDVTGFAFESGRVFVGLPQREGRILGDLVRAGEVGFELQLDPEAPIIVGVYPMRPVTRQ